MSQSSAPLLPLRYVPEDAKDPNETWAPPEHTPTPSKPARDWKFWTIILSLMVTTAMTAIELTAIGTALPTIVDTLGGENFVWIGSAYNLGQTVLIPFSGGLSQIFGRRAVTLASIALFCIGSVICGAANSMNVLIVGRAVQGLGSGGMNMITQIIIADLVSLQERGVFNGIIGIAWGVGGGAGPAIGGALADAGYYRWLFYMNIPICAVAALLVALFLKLKTPKSTLKEKLRLLDGIGNLLITCSTTLALIGLTWGGADYPWSSKEVLIPLIVGILGFGVFLAYEAWIAAEPIVPMTLMKTRTALSGYAQTFLLSIILSGVAYWFFVYFQACLGLSATASGVRLLAITLSIVPGSLIGGIVIQRTSRYRGIMWFSWVVTIFGMGLFITLDENTKAVLPIVFQIILGLGVGVVYVAAYFPVLAPIKVTQNAQAIAFFVFLRNVAMVWGVTIGGAILQNVLEKELPSQLLTKLPAKAHIALALVPAIDELPEPIQSQVKHAFALSLRVFWILLTGLAGLGLVASGFMKALPLHTSVDRTRGRKDEYDVIVELGPDPRKNAVPVGR